MVMMKFGLRIKGKENLLRSQPSNYEAASKPANQLVEEDGDGIWLVDNVKMATMVAMASTPYVYSSFENPFYDFPGESLEVVPVLMQIQ